MEAPVIEKYSYRVADGIQYMTRAEVDFVKKLAPLLPQHAVCVNVGMGAATSVIALLEERPELIVYSVDINPDNGMSQLYESGFTKNVVKIIGDSKEVEWLYGEISFAFIDAGHQREEVLADVNAWCPRMAKNAIMMFHDYAAVHWHGVKEVVDSVAGNWEFLGLVDTLIAFRVNTGDSE